MQETSLKCFSGLAVPSKLLARDWPSGPCSPSFQFPVFNVASVSRPDPRNMYARDQQPMAVETPFPHQAWWRQGSQQSPGGVGASSAGSGPGYHLRIEGLVADAADC